MGVHATHAIFAVLFIATVNADEGEYCIVF